jgi:NDP-sugar pyrophosphorylase family protein
MNEFTIPALFDLSTFKHAQVFEDCVYPWDVLSKIHAYLKSIPLGKTGVGIPKGADLIFPELISIGKGTVIEPGVYIKGPCIIGENCTIRQGAYIRGDVIVGDRCVVGHDSELKNSIMLNDSNAAHFAYVGDSILGNKVNLGAGTKLANFRLDHKEINVYFNGEKISTGRRKFGAILGDGTQIGCNSVANPGVITGKNVQCHPCINFSGVIPKDSMIKPPAPLVITKK